MSNSSDPTHAASSHESTDAEFGGGSLPFQHESTSPHELSPFGLSGRVVAPASLVAAGGRLAGKAFALTGAEIVIGRSRLAGVYIDDRSVSSRHALVRRVRAWHEVTDLGSTNGTLLNGRRLTPNRPAELHPGDTLQIADCILVYLAEGMTDANEVTQALAVVTPQVGSAAISQLNPDEILAQLLLKINQPTVDEARVSLDAQVDRVMRVVNSAKPYLPMVASLGAIFALLGVGTVVLAPPLAEASFMLMLTPQASDNPVGDRSSSGHFQFFTSAESNFLNPTLIEGTLEKIGIESPNDDQVSAVEKALSFTNLSPSSFVAAGPATYRGAYKHRSPEAAVRFLKAHVENYLQSEISKTLKVVQKQVDFLAQQTHEKEGELRETESKLKSFRDKYLSMLPEYTEGHVTSLETLRQRQADLKARVSATSAAVSAAKQELKMLAGVDESKVIGAQPYQQALADANVKLAQARASGLGESHPDVVRLKQQVESLQQEHRRALATDPSTTELRGNRAVSEVRRALAQREVDAQAAGAELGQVGDQIARLESLVRQSPGVAEAYAELTRSYAVSTETNQRLLRELDEARVQLNLERASAEKRYEIVLSPKSQPIPIRRTLATRAAIGGVLGTVIGALIAFVRFAGRWMKDRPQRLARAAVAQATVLRGATGQLPSLLPPPAATKHRSE